ncbi:TMEM175 family protein [Terriglobus tenax]|uniref:TMEM175 family protein n=1 Tax=Terriglobus tenax TaxID=1111115 RepID=UPI0021DF9B61|nr:TMEM175 family protein [Terriglobus tenax]
MTTHQLTPTRLEAFSDGVIAIIITIMVLELKVPHEDGFAGLRTVLPTLAIYALSFLFTGTYWINHHALIHRIRMVNHRILWANLFFLFTLSLLPYFTDWIGEHKISSFSAALYAATLLLQAIGFMLLRLAVNQMLAGQGDLDHEDHTTHRKHLLCMMIYLLAIPAAYLRPWLSFALAFVVTVIWITPTFATRRSRI